VGEVTWLSGVAFHLFGCNDCHVQEFVCSRSADPDFVKPVLLGCFDCDLEKRLQAPDDFCCVFCFVFHFVGRWLWRLDEVFQIFVVSQ